MPDGPAIGSRGDAAAASAPLAEPAQAEADGGGRRWAVAGATLAIGGLGSLVFTLLGVPAAFLTGPAVAIVLAVALRVPTHMPSPVRAGGIAILGAATGSAVTPEAVDQMAAVPLAIGGLVLVILGAAAASYVTLRRVGGWDRLDALCGSIPGHLALVMEVSTEAGARMDRVMMSQSTRLFILVALIPFVLGGSDEARLTIAADGLTLTNVALTLLLAAAAALVGRLIRLPAAIILGPLAAAAVVSATDLMTIALPPWLVAVSLAVLGISVGEKFATVRRAGLARMIAASLAAFLAAFVVAMAISAVFAWALGMPVGAVFLAYAPGGLDAMIALAFLLNFEVAFVAVIHMSRMVLLSLGMPFVVAAFARRERRLASPQNREVPR
ncbi:AbrB family transcriptional regulator [Acuticoccus sp.]|uniref:AbrB family transcriptional regulator n=1 Tax=Acuticoccus sp. TaxID=1904378 RepID=UPI003B52D9CC